VENQRETKREAQEMQTRIGTPGFGTRWQEPGSKNPPTFNFHADTLISTTSDDAKFLKTALLLFTGSSCQDEGF
jgi:hypothetical protein